MTESKILHEVRAWLASQPDVSIHRNNVGKLPDVNGRVVTYGLAIGSSDLIGSLTVAAAPTHWPCRHEPHEKHSIIVARALAIEVKTATGRVTEDQERFLAEKRRIGWITGVVRSVADVDALIGRARRWEV